MSEQPKVDLGGFNIKEWSLLILVAGLVFVFIVVGYAFATAIANPESNVVLSGTLDISQFVSIILGIAMVATVLVSQQLTSRTQAAAVRATDEVWMAENRKP